MCTTMNNKYMILVATVLAACSLTACMDDTPEPPVSQDDGVTSPVSIGKPNTTISKIKDAHSSVMANLNQYELVEKDEILEGVVVANDESGNLYQTLVIRDVADGSVDQCIQIGIRMSSISPFFPLGKGIRINVKDLYIGNYSAVPKIGQPYITSKGNPRLGPMLFNLCRSHIELFDVPASTKAKALTPIKVDGAWMTSNQTYASVPALASVEGTFKDADGVTIFAPDELKDDGYAVDREFNLDSSTKIEVRTSTQNDISYTILPTGKVRLTGIISYYPGSGWQLQLRSLQDLEIIKE